MVDPGVDRRAGAQGVLHTAVDLLRFELFGLLEGLDPVDVAKDVLVQRAAGGHVHRLQPHADPQHCDLGPLGQQRLEALAPAAAQQVG